MRLADLPAALQEQAAPLIRKNGIRPEQLRQLRPDMEPAELDDLLEQEGGAARRPVTVSLEVPAALRREFLAMARAWLEEREGDA